MEKTPIDLPIWSLKLGLGSVDEYFVLCARHKWGRCHCWYWSSQGRDSCLRDGARTAQPDTHAYSDCHGYSYTDSYLHSDAYTKTFSYTATASGTIASPEPVVKGRAPPRPVRAAVGPGKRHAEDCPPCRIRPDLWSVIRERWIKIHHNSEDVREPAPPLSQCRGNEAKETKTIKGIAMTQADIWLFVANRDQLQPGCNRADSTSQIFRRLSTRSDGSRSNNDVTFKSLQFQCNSTV